MVLFTIWQLWVNNDLWDEIRNGPRYKNDMKPSLSRAWSDFKRLPKPPYRPHPKMIQTLSYGDTLTTLCREPWVFIQQCFERKQLGGENKKQISATVGLKNVQLIRLKKHQTKNIRNNNVDNNNSTTPVEPNDSNWEWLNSSCREGNTNRNVFKSPSHQDIFGV